MMSSYSILAVLASQTELMLLRFRPRRPVYVRINKVISAHSDQIVVHFQDIQSALIAGSEFREEFRYGVNFWETRGWAIIVGLVAKMIKKVGKKVLGRRVSCAGTRIVCASTGNFGHENTRCWFERLLDPFVRSYLM